MKIVFLVLVLILQISTIANSDEKKCQGIKKLSKEFLACNVNNIKQGTANKAQNLKQNTSNKAQNLKQGIKNIGNKISKKLKKKE
jgi:hypothetical protein